MRAVVQYWPDEGGVWLAKLSDRQTTRHPMFASTGEPGNVQLVDKEFIPLPPGLIAKGLIERWQPEETVRTFMKLHLYARIAAEIAK